MYSLLVASRQLYGEFLVELFAQLLNPMAAEGKNQQQLKVSIQSAETLGWMASWLVYVFGAMLLWLLLTILVLLLLVAALHRPLPPGISDRKKILVLEFLLRISNEYFGNFVEFMADPVTRNKLTRFLSALPYWLFQSRPPKWCRIKTEAIRGVKCRIYLPQGEIRRDNAAIIYIHGGGWCMGRPRFYDNPLLHIVKNLGIPIISIDYSLSPEVRFPTALLECEGVLEELHQQKFAELGIDKSRVALMGDSAGGNQCAVLCQRALRAGRKSMIKCQVLLYPVIHMFDFCSPSYRYFYGTYPGTGLLNPRMLIRWYLFYLGIEPSDENIRAMSRNNHLSCQIREDKELMALIDHSRLPKGLPGQGEPLPEEKIDLRGRQNCISGKLKRKIRGAKVADSEVVQSHFSKLADQMTPLLRNPDVCPLVANDINQELCPALICTAGVDILRDEGIIYAQRLRQFGVQTEWKHYETAFHGILMLNGSKQRAQILDDICDYLQRKLIDV